MLEYYMLESSINNLDFHDLFRLFTVFIHLFVYGIFVETDSY